MQSAPNAPNQTRHQKYPTYVHCRTLSPKFWSVLIYDQPFSRYCTFYYLPIDFYVKISKCHKIFNLWQIAKNVYNFTFSYDCLIYNKVWLRSDKNGRRSNILNFPAPYGPVLTKISSKCHKIFGRSPKKYTGTLYSPISNILKMKFDWNQMKIGKGVEFWKS